MLALALRQAVRRGARVYVLDPRPVQLPLEFVHLPVPLGNLNTCLGLITRLALEGDPPTDWPPEALAFFSTLPTQSSCSTAIQNYYVAAITSLKASRNPVLVCGTDQARPTTPGFLADLAHLLRLAGKEAGLFYLLPGPNAFGAALLSAGEEAADPVAALEEGTVKALILVENDPLATYPDRQRLAQGSEKT